MSNPREAYESLLAELREIAVLGSIGSLAGWDERTYMPPGGAQLRSKQASLLAKLVHQRMTSPRIGQLLSAIEGSDLVRDALSDPAVNVRETRRSYDRATRLPEDLVRELAETSVLAEQAWVEARKASSFAAFAPWLAKMVGLKQRQARCLGYADHPYDALLDDYEPGETTRNVARIFESLREPLVQLIGRIMGSGRQAPLSLLERPYPAALQEKLARQAAMAVGFDFARGRLDVTVHPFCSGVGPGDTRLTTRYDGHWFGDGFFGVLHEVGHGLYEQGLDEAHFGTPRGDSVSLGIHESQSRLWENFVGRSRGFWRHFLPRARQTFGATLDDVGLEEWVWAINDVRPSFIRTESDETTYNLHTLLRFELEQAMLTGDLPIDDVPAAWNAKMKQYLGIAPPDDARGCLQDVHWSGGGIGYFPTYTLGNLYAAQFFEQAGAELGDMEEQFARGEFRPLLDWLRAKIHTHGKRYRAADLVKVVTGQPLSPEPLLGHLRRKAEEMYGV
jgi:carboxypeptidase Taq